VNSQIFNKEEAVSKEFSLFFCFEGQVKNQRMASHLLNFVFSRFG
jgi:hypothetical protein